VVVSKASLLLLFLYPVASVVLLVLILHCAPGHPMGAAFLSVLLFCGVEGLLVDLLCVLGKVASYPLWQINELVVRYYPSFSL
jgi:hypothetical protein